MGYIQFRWDKSPGWMMGPNGQAWSSGFGQAENALIQQTIWGIQARYPVMAPMDLPPDPLNPSAPSSHALALIGVDRQMLPTFPDNARFDGYRAWLQSGMTPPPTPVGWNIADGGTNWVWNGGTFGPDAVEAAWSPGTAYVEGQSVGFGGYVYVCQSTGTSGEAIPFPVVEDARAPGWAFAGTDTGLIAALVNSGFWTRDANGNVVLPRIYNNTDFYTLSMSSSGGEWGFSGASTIQTTDIKAVVLASGTAGSTSSSDTGIVSVTPVSPPSAWAPNTDYNTGDFVVSMNMDVYICVNPGRSGGGPKSRFQLQLPRLLIGHPHLRRVGHRVR